MSNRKLELDFRDDYENCNGILLSGDSKNWFKTNVTANLDIELNRNCNFAGCGICHPYCPKGLKSDPKEDVYMSWEIFKKLISNLVEVDYEGTLSLNGYNEPLFMNIDELEKRIQYIHRELPNCNISINTNGSLLTKDKLDRLHKVGLNTLNLQIYPRSEKDRNEFHFSFAEDAMLKYKERLLIETSIHQNIKGFMYSWKITNYEPIDSRGIQFIVYAKNLTEHGCNRGGAIKLPSAGGHVRKTPCHQIGRFLSVKYDGELFMCANMYSGYAEHKKFSLGNLSTMNLWDAYAVLVERGYLKTMTGDEHEKYYATCKGCNYVPNAEQIRRAIKMLEEAN